MLCVGVRCISAGVNGTSDMLCSVHGDNCEPLEHMGAWGEERFWERRVGFSWCACFSWWPSIVVVVKVSN